MIQFNKTLLAIAITLASTQASAAGFQLNSQSATGLGRAMAGDAIIADNASVLARNPAAMALFEEKTLSANVTYAAIDVSIDDVSANTIFGKQDFGGLDSAADDKIIPSFFYINPVNDKIAFGFGAFSNYGTGTDLTEIAERSPLAPVDLLGNTEVTTVNLNASMSYRVNDEFSFGVGIDAIYGSGSLSRHSKTFGNLVDVEADGWAIGAIVGFAYEVNENHRFGLSYRASPDITAKGDIAYLGQDYQELAVPIADIAQFAGFHQLTDKFAVHYTIQWTEWSSFDKLKLKDGSVSPQATLKEYHWSNSWFTSLGATYNVNESWIVRAGVASDQGVVDEISSLSIPDSDRMWYSAGFSYILSPNSTIDFGVTAVRGEEVHVLEKSALPIYTNDISAYTHSNAMYYSLQYNYTF